MKFLMSLLLAALLLAADPVAGADDDYEYEEADDDEEYYNEFEVCEDSIVVVNQISILCDSPGTYYYGSGKYRNSAKCQGGDKAKLEIELEVTEDLNEEDAAAYLTVLVEGYGTVSDVSINTREDMCQSQGTLISYDGSTPCSEYGYLEAGKYYIKEQFYWGDQDDSYEYSFKPKVVIGIQSNINKDQYDLGGANTNKCDGNTFVKWTTGVRKSMANTLRTFFLTFGILTGAIFSILLASWCVYRAFERTPPPQSIEEELLEKEDQHKVAMIGKNADLVDF